MADDKTFHDEVIEQAVKLGIDIVKQAAKAYPRPPGYVKLSEKEQLAWYMSLSEADLNQLITVRGQPAVEHMIFRMEKLRKKYSTPQEVQNAIRKTNR